MIRDAEETNVIFDENKRELREVWLDEEGRTDGDIMTDDKGEYIIDIDEEGTNTRVYFPDHLQHYEK